MAAAAVGAASGHARDTETAVPSSNRTPPPIPVVAGHTRPSPDTAPPARNKQSKVKTEDTAREPNMNKQKTATASKSATKTGPRLSASPKKLDLDTLLEMGDDEMGRIIDQMQTAVTYGGLVGIM